MANEKATQLWFGKAREDLMTAKALNSHNDDFNTVIVFHCQQAAEKSIKGFLTHHNIRVLKTHDMEKLLTGVAKIAPELANTFAKAITLTKYAVEYRYPDADMKLPPLTPDLVNEAVKLAENIYNKLTELVRSATPMD